jgi:transcriptional regulator with XRE-family HTH domain
MAAMRNRRKTSKTPTVKQVLVALGLRIRQNRRRLGFTQVSLARRVRLSANFVAHLERGSRGPSVETLVTLARAFGVPVHALLKP